MTVAAGACAARGLPRPVPIRRGRRSMDGRGPPGSPPPPRGIAPPGRPRVRGRSKYGTLDRLWVGLFDLVGMCWLQRRGARPDVEGL